MSEEDVAGILNALDLDDATRFADINARAPALAVALHHRYGAAIDVIGVDRKGEFVEPDTDTVATYMSYMAQHGVDPDAVRVISRKKQIERCDVIAYLRAGQPTPPVDRLRRVFRFALHDNSRCVAEIKKGSGAYPFLRKYGGINTLRAPGPDANGLVVMSVEPRAEPKDDWSDIAKTLAGPDGFYTDCGAHSFVHVKRGDTLVVTFDNLDITMNKREDRRPWGFSFIEAQGWSMLGVMANGWTWFRDDAVTAEFNRLRDTGFFAQFKRVVFYGASMGGYAAAAFSAAAPGATVLAISPQSTLDKSIVPWETRYQKVWERDFSGPYGDASIASQTAEAVHIIYDPYVPLDAGHVDRFTGANVTRWRGPLLGHRLGSSLNQMGILQEIAAKAISGTLEAATFHTLLRQRHSLPRYQKELANLAIDRGHTALALKVCDYVLRQRDDKYFKNMRARLTG